MKCHRMSRAETVVIGVGDCSAYLLLRELLESEDISSRFWDFIWRRRLATGYF